MTNTHPHSEPSKPTIKYLKDLAISTGQSFSWPQTQQQASEEIDRLKGVKRTSRADRRRETREVRDAMARGGDAAAVRSEELRGYGSTASWLGGS